MASIYRSMFARRSQAVAHSYHIGSNTALPNAANFHAAAMQPQQHQPQQPAQGRVRVYTKTGDGGSSVLFNRQRKPKDDLPFVALGDTDELNSQVGVAVVQCASSGVATLKVLQSQLINIQSRLFDIGSHIATPRTTSSAEDIGRTQFDSAHIAELERWIDEMDDTLTPLRAFILPGGGAVSAHLHVCRSVCRRAERAVVPLLNNSDIEPAVFKYLNRLSDYFFVAARYAAAQTGNQETIWRKA